MKISQGKNNPILLIVVFSCIQTCLALGQSNTLMVEVEKCRNDKGVVSVSLFKVEKDYMKDFSNSLKATVVNGKAVVHFENLPQGEYAISIMHDENGNGELDSNFFRMPKEGIGFSNDASATFGPPPWDKAKFSWKPGDKTQVIHVRYL